MGRFVDWLQAVSLTLGAPGLFLVALLDSSVLSLPEVADLLVVLTVTARKPFMLLYAASATLGSLTGCLILYSIGRKGGGALLRRRFNAQALERTLARLQRYGILAVLIPSILPPPAPFKMFVLLSGAAGISRRQFVTAILIGRSIRYFGLGLLAVWYGEQAMAFLRAHGKSVALGVVAALVAGFLAYIWWNRRRASAGL
jgi:membrane protein YqaA with SNARE-associated domain